MKNSTILLTFALLLFFSCKEKDDNTITPPAETMTATDYFPLTVGSYWVYQWYSIDTAGVENIYSTTDSVYVAADTIINGKNYAVFQGTEFGNQFKHYYRDSSGLIVDEQGSIPLFTIHEEPELLGIDTFWVNNAPWFWREYKMVPNADITVPAGSFDQCLSTATYLTPIEPNAENGVRTYPFNYAEGVGLIRHRTSFYFEETYFESRLTNYHIKPGP